MSTDEDFEIIQVVEASILTLAAVAYTLGAIVVGGSFFGVRFWNDPPTGADRKKAEMHRFAMIVMAGAQAALALAVWAVWLEAGTRDRPDGITVTWSRWVGYLIWFCALAFAYAMYTRISSSYTMIGIGTFAGSIAFVIFALLTPKDTTLWTFYLVIAIVLNLTGAGMFAISRRIKMLPFAADLWTGLILEAMFLLNGLWLVLGPEIATVLSLWVTALLYAIVSFLTALVPCGIIALTFFSTELLSRQSQQDGGSDDIPLLGKFKQNQQFSNADLGKNTSVLKGTRNRGAPPKGRRKRNSRPGKQL